MNTYEKSEHGVTLFLDAQSSMEAAFTYYAVDVLEGNSEPAYEMWDKCKKGAQAKLGALRAASLGLDTEQAFLDKKTIGEYSRKQWQMIKAGIVQFHLDQVPPREFVAPLKAPKAPPKPPTAEEKAAEKVATATKKLLDVQTTKARTTRDVLTKVINAATRNLTDALKAGDAKAIKSARAILDKIEKAITRAAQ
jgi:hypothetical protein